VKRKSKNELGIKRGRGGEPVHMSWPETIKCVLDKIDNKQVKRLRSRKFWK
jgi:hypothetical protein